MESQFAHLFSYQHLGQRLQCGNEFICYFVSALHCRVFAPQQCIVNRGDYFSELFLLFNGRVTLSLQSKDEHEFLTLYSGNIFGDYQLLLGLKATAVFKAEQKTFCHCLKRAKLLELLSTFPAANTIFTDRALKRRIEFRRIQK